MRLSYAIVFVSDMKRSVSFYRDVMEIPLRFESPVWTEFETEGATLALHVSDQGNSGKESPQMEPAGRCRPGFRVSNLDEFHKKMVEKKVSCVQKPQETFGVRIAQYVDPDGLPISVSQDASGR